MKSRIGTALGKETPDPWNPADAIMGMAFIPQRPRGRFSVHI